MPLPALTCNPKAASNSPRLATPCVSGGHKIGQCILLETQFKVAYEYGLVENIFDIRNPCVGQMPLEDINHLCVNRMLRMPQGYRWWNGPCISTSSCPLRWFLRRGRRHLTAWQTARLCTTLLRDNVTTSRKTNATVENKLVYSALSLSDVIWCRERSGVHRGGCRGVCGDAMDCCGNKTRCSIV